MELTIPEFVFVLLAGCGLMVSGVACISRWRHARAEMRSLSERIICRLCLHAFVDESHTQKGRVTECPNCGTANEKRG